MLTMKVKYRKPLIAEFLEMGKVANKATFHANKKIFPRHIYRRASAPETCFQDFFEDGSIGRCRIAEINQKIVGVCFLGKNYLGSLYVLPEYQGKGIGNRLLQWAEDRARKYGFIECHAEMSSVSFYTNKKWKIISVKTTLIANRGNLPLVEMKKILKGK